MINFVKLVGNKLKNMKNFRKYKNIISNTKITNNDFEYIYNNFSKDKNLYYPYQEFPVINNSVTIDNTYERNTSYCSYFCLLIMVFFFYSSIIITKIKYEFSKKLID
tara:strand:- start:43 stop:363 length:321 start_codon:yes stop_codon:yes gene_type:complete